MIDLTRFDLLESYFVPVDFFTKVLADEKKRKFIIFMAQYQTTYH
jgi:hypothetical protein